MAWTAPYTWSVGEQATAAKFNQHIRDNLAYLKGQAGQVDLEDHVRLNNAKQLKARNAANSADLRLLDVDSGNHLSIGRDDAIGDTQLFGDVRYYDDAASPSEIARATSGEGVVSQGMRAHRHPYASHRHIESGEITHDVAAKSVSYTDAFAAAPVVTTSNDVGGQVFHTATARGTGGHTQNSVGTGGANAGGQGMWHAEGAD